MNSVEHYILCRYNCNLFDSNPYNIKNPIEWMEDRYIKFQKLLDSIENQTISTFYFIIFIDPKTNQDLQEKLVELISTKLKTKNWELSKLSVKDYFKNKKINTPYIITSRVDNDDEYYPKFAEIIQGSFNEVEESLDVRGIQFDVKTKIKYTSGRITPNSPFISLIEKTNDIKTVFFTQHSNICKKVKCGFVNYEHPLYIQNIHNNNIINKIIGEKII